MPGARDTDWSHIRVVGDKDAAAPYVSFARKLLGFVKEDAAHNGLQTHQATKKLPDGTVVIAEIHGMQPIMTIIPHAVGMQTVRTLEGFYFSRRNANTPENTAAVLRDPTEDRDWKSYFYNVDADGYAATPEDRRGTYAAVFGGKTETPWERLEVAGGLWMDRATKEAVSWFRGYMGYWPMHFRHPITNYAPFVSIYGHLVYTAPDLMWRVMAAAKRDGFLYVLLCENLGALSPPERPATADESGMVWFSQPFTDAMYTYKLWRYPLAVVTKRDTLIESYKAAPHEDAELLWSGDLELAYGAWSFNADCTSVVTIQLPRRAMLALHTYKDGALWKTSTDVFDDYPVVESKRLELTIEHNDSGPPVAAYNESAAPETIAEEDGVTLDLVLAAHTTSPGTDVTTYARMEYRCGDFAIAAFDGNVNAAPTARYQTTRTIYYAHLPSKTFVFLKRFLGTGGTRQVVLEYELYVDGVLVPITDDPYKVDTVLASTPAAVISGYAEARLSVPWMGVFDLGGEFALKVDFDAMTFLYGVSIDRRSTGDATGGGGPNSQAFLIPTLPYVPFTCRLEGVDPDTASGAVDTGSGAGGWSVSKHGGPGPTFAWDDGNPFAPPVYFNNGEYDDPAPSAAPYSCGFGYALAFDGQVVTAFKGDPWGTSPDDGGGNLYPYAGSDDGQFYPLRYGTNGDARPLIDAIDPRLADADTIYFTTYSLGHTGSTRPGQKNGMIQQHNFELPGAPS